MVEKKQQEGYRTRLRTLTLDATHEEEGTRFDVSPHEVDTRTTNLF